MNHQTAMKNELRQHVESQSVPSRQDTVGTKIRHHAETQPDQPALVSSGFAPLSYRELQHQIDAVRSTLRRAGFGQQARIAIAMPNGPQAALAIVAVSCSAVSVPFNPRQTFPEFARCLATVRPDAVLLIKGDDSVARQAAETGGVTIVEAVQANTGFLAFDIDGPSTVEVASDEPDASDPEALAFIFQTSGTTAEPKLIPFSHRNMLAAAIMLQTWYNLAPQDCCLSVSPLFYSHGLKVTVFTPLLTGGTVAFPMDASKFNYSEWFGRLKPTWYSAGPTLHRLVFDQIKSRAGAIADSSLRFVVSGGAPLPRDILDGLQHLLSVPVVEQYGTSEAAVVASNAPPPGRSKPGTCGVPWPDTVRIVSEDGRPVSSREKGEILLGGPSLISGYLDAPELNRASFVGGRFRTGDIGSFDEDGFLTLHGRKSDLINRGGEKISPAEIDEALMSHPAVLEAAVFAVPHVRLGEDVVAAVVLRDGMTVTSVELRMYLQERVTTFKIPRRIVFRKQLPKGTTGKVLRRRLTESWKQVAERATRGDTDNKSADNELVKELTNLWERLLKVSPLSPDDDFFERGGDSLLAMYMLAELEWRTGLTIPGSILFEATTIRQLALKLAQRQNLHPKYLIEMNSSGDQPPLIYFHGNVHGFGQSVVTLAKLLGPTQPLLVIAPHGTGDEPIPRSIEIMAADRLSLIMKAQPEGPYRLGGKCLGGIVAFEVARKLIAAGKEVEMVIMLDPPTINARKAMQVLFSIMRAGGAGPHVERAMAWTWFRSVQLQRFWNYPWTRRAAAVSRRLGPLADKAAGHFVRRSSSQVSAAPVALDRFGTPILGTTLKDVRTSKYATVMSYYVPKPLAVPVTYVKVDFGVGAWRRIAPDLEVVTSPGTHELPDIASVAEHLKVRLKIKT
jgi:oxalate---CoA ligase